MDAAASELARGLKLHDVLDGLPERPAYAAAVRLGGATSDAAISRAAAARFCSDLATPTLALLGIARFGDSLWVIVTEPFVSPDRAARLQSEATILRTVNSARARGARCGATYYPPVAPVQLSARLGEVALRHSSNMAAREQLEHEERNGTSAADRVHGAGIAARHVGENIAAGVPTAETVIDGWLASPSHCSVIMDARFTQMGVSYAVRPHSRSVIYWTQLFTEPP